MPRPSVIPEIKDQLEAWLNARAAEYEAQPESARKPTLPHTPDFKINVSAVASAIGLKETQRKYLHEREELRSLVDMIAEGQGLLPVGGRLLDEADKAVQQKMMLQARQAKGDAQAAAEASAQVAAVMEELQAAQVRIAELEIELMRYRAREEMLYSGIAVRIEE